MILSQLLHAINVEAEELPALTVTSIVQDSRLCTTGCLFLGLVGAEFDGSAYCDIALKSGALFCLHNNPNKESSRNCLYIANLREHLPTLLETFYGTVHQKYTGVGITGTNGKTTMMTLCRALFARYTNGVVALGTIENQIGTKITPAALTTPDVVSLYQYLSEGLAEGATHWVMEASSHALSQNRLGHLKFDAAVYTNLTQDHLDYHGTMEAYYEAKKLLFTKHLKADGLAIVNGRDACGQRLLAELKNTDSKPRLVMYNSDILAAKMDHQEFDTLYLVSVTVSSRETRMDIEWNGVEHHVVSYLPGRINVENALAFLALGLSMEFPISQLEDVLKTTRVPGRNERYDIPSGGWALVDYAHTPDALERTLQSCREMVKGKLMVVFGCGGDRDRGKRPLMGDIAAKYSDRVIVTSDNPRTEDPLDIIQQILTGIPSSKDVIVMSDRAQAIHMGLSWVGADDALVVAGKGHENYQILGKKKFPFSDQQEIEKFCAIKSGDVL